MARPLDRMNPRSNLATRILCGGAAVGLLGVAGLLAASGAAATRRDGAGAESNPTATEIHSASNWVANGGATCRAVDLASARECAPGSALGRAVPQVGEWLLAQRSVR